MTVGAAGGPKIITQVLLAVIRHLDYGQSLADAVGGARFHHQWRPDSVLIEATADVALKEKLKRVGHKVETSDRVGVTQAIGIDADGSLIGVHDPRIPGKVGRATRVAPR